MVLVAIVALAAETAANLKILSGDSDRRIREMQLFAEIAIRAAICNSLHSTFVPVVVSTNSPCSGDLFSIIGR
jgi:hypothetical protein